MNEKMETATGPGAECTHVTVFWPMKSCRQMSPRDPSENNKKSYFHCTVIIITSYFITYYSFLHTTYELFDVFNVSGYV